MARGILTRTTRGKKSITGRRGTMTIIYGYEDNEGDMQQSTIKGNNKRNDNDSNEEEGK